MAQKNSSRLVLSLDLRRLCEQASGEYDAFKLLEITTQVNELLEKQDAEKRKAFQPLTAEILHWGLEREPAKLLLDPNRRGTSSAALIRMCRMCSAIATFSSAIT